MLSRDDAESTASAGQYADMAEQPSVHSQVFMELGQDIKICSGDGFMTKTRAKLLLNMPAEEVPFHLPCHPCVQHDIALAQTLLFGRICHCACLEGSL